MIINLSTKHAIEPGLITYVSAPSSNTVPDQIIFDIPGVGYGINIGEHCLDFRSYKGSINDNCEWLIYNYTKGTILTLTQE